MRRILIITDYYLPGFKGGGPIRTIANTIDWLGDEFEFLVLAGDRDFKDEEPYPDIQYGAWVPVNGAKVRYLSPQERSFSALGKVISGIDYDLLYVNSFFAPMCAKTVLLHGLRRIPRERPVLLAPRNEFFPDSLSLKAWKKRPYLALVKALGFDKKILWQATSTYEVGTIRKQFPSGQILFASNLGMKHPPAIAAVKPKSQPLRVIYLSRIDRKKNLDHALRMLQQIQIPLIFDIYGPREDPEYWTTCESLMQELPPHIEAQYRGEVKHDQVLQTLHKYDVFLLPTRGENYGHVIWEALYAGCLPVISDRTPWTDELHAREIGWAHPLDAPERFAASLETIAAMPEPEYQRRAQAAQALARENASPDALLEANRSMFRRVLGIEPQQETA